MLIFGGYWFSTLVCGETGVGKEVVVRQLHHKSDRSEKPFVKEIVLRCLIC